ncbi:hypothetical protein EMM73_15635 [Rheinheimera sediminis]|uniref:TniB family NTP-binding protein n=1 Tax=Rheinheimera sp. YQF-1 TaxID=2499626 RepID=UPI000FDA654C|nr:TniB family NTP-binding protein [Rheinheimera sp. YQF-1]RVT44736.1 hypothetical protein EMM73_15635 [Rheinheimera sp. YQF-1]
MSFRLLQNEQLQAFSDSLVEHTQVKTIFSDFDDLRMNRLFQSDQQCMLLTGDTGVGKSHLINHYRKRVLASQHYGRERMPILISRIASNQGLDATLIDMISDLELFGSAQRKKRGYQTDLVTTLVNSLIRAEVELLIINEFQELIEYKTQRERQAIANALKFISEEAKVPIVLVGMPWADHIAKEPQWSSRLVRRRRLDYFSIVNDRAYYLRYLKGLAKHMPFDTPPTLEDADIAIALFAATQGENRKLKHLLIETIKIAMVCGAKTLDVSHFVEVFDKLFSEESSSSRKRVNPFTQKADEIKISEVVELSRYIPNASAPIGRMFSLPQTLIEINGNPRWNENPIPYEALSILL